jgi:hypothetical protein
MALPNRAPNPDAGIPDLVGRLADDSRRLLGDEARLAKLELREGAARAKSGAQVLAVAFGTGVAAAAALTLLVATGVGRLAAGHMWVGAIMAGVLDLLVGALLIAAGALELREPGAAVAETRDALP